MIGELGMVIGIGRVGVSILLALWVVREWSWSKPEEAVEQEQEHK